MSARASALTSRALPSKAPGLRVVRRRSKSLIKRGAARRVAPLYIATAIAAAAVIAAVLLAQVVLAQSAFKLTKINDRLAVAEARHEQLLAQVALLESPGRIERYARSELGMVDPIHVEYVVARVNFPGAKNRLADAMARDQLAPPGVGTAVERP